VVAAVAVGAVPPVALGALVHLVYLTLVRREDELVELVQTLPAPQQWGRPADREDDDEAGDDDPVPGETLDEKRERLLRAGAGRRRLARELDITEHEARALVEAYRAGGAA
jgi:hypothetical protein